MSAENVEKLKRTITIWRNRKVSVNTASSQVLHDHKLAFITLDEAMRLITWIAEIYRGK